MFSRHIAGIGVVAFALCAGVTAWFADQRSGPSPESVSTPTRDTFTGAFLSRLAAWQSEPIEQPTDGSGSRTPESEGSPTATLDVSQLPAELRNFLQSHSHAYLRGSPGSYLQASGRIPASPELWKQLAEVLSAEDPGLAAEALAWLGAQNQTGAYIALAGLWGELIHRGVDPFSANGASQPSGIDMNSMPLPDSRQALMALAGLAVIPGPILQDFQERIRQAAGAYAEFMAMIGRSTEPETAAALLALGGDQMSWDVAMAAGDASAVAREAATSAIAAMADTSTIDRLLAVAQAGNLDLAVSIAGRWAGQQLSGERLDRLDQLAQAGAFQGANGQLLVALLAHAEDGAGAADIAGRLGVALPVRANAVRAPSGTN